MFIYVGGGAGTKVVVHVLSHTLLLVSNHSHEHAVTENNKINTGMNIK